MMSSLPSASLQPAAPTDLESALQELSGLTASSSERSLSEALRIGREALGADRIALWLGASPSNLTCRVNLPADAPPLSPSDRVAQSASVASVAAANNTLLTSPVGPASEPLGVLACERSPDQPWNTSERLFLFAIAQFVALVIEQEGRRALEAAKAEQELRLSQLEELSGLGSWIWDVPSGIITVSQKLKARIGGSVNTTTYERTLEMVHPEDRQFVAETIEAALKREGSYSYEARTIRPDGSTGWVASRATIERDSDGQAVRLVGTVQDVTELRRTQEALRTSESRFRGLFAQFPFSVQIFDPSGFTVQVNRAFEEFWGYGMEALEGFNLLAEPQLEPIRELIQRGFSGETVFLPAVLFDGSKVATTPEAAGARWVQAFMFPVRDPSGRLREVILVHQDVTQQKQAEEQLRISEESYRTIFNLAGDAVFVHDPVTGAVLDVNHEACAIHGLSYEELKQQGLAAITGSTDQFTQQAAVELIRKAAAGEPQRFEWLSLQPSGKRVWVEVSLNGVNILGEDRVLANVRVINDRKLAEEALRSAYEELEHRVADRTSELQAANEALSRAVREHEIAREELTRRTAELEGVFQTLPDLYFRMTSDGVILQHRSGSGQGLYLPPDQFLGQKITSIMPPEVAALVQAGLDEVRTTGALAVVEYELTVDNVTQEFEARLLPLPDGLIISIVRDITARKRAERALKEREEHFRKLIENAHDLVQVLDAAGRVTYTGPSVEHLLGYSPEELVGSNPMELVADEDLAHMGPALQDVIEHPGTIRSARYRVRHKNGSWRVFEAFGRTMLPNSAEAGVVVNARDVTERQKMEEALRVSEEHFRKLIDNAHDMVVILDREGRTTYGSPSVQRILGYDPEGLAGQNTLEFVHPEDVEQVIEGLRRLGENSGVPARIECRFRHQDGSWRYLEAVGSPLVTESEEPGFVFNVRDVTERHAAEDALREREERFRNLIENAHDITCICDEHGVLLYQSPSFERRLGYSPEDLMLRSGFPYIHEADTAVIQESLATMIAAPGTVVRLEYRFRHKNGEWRMLEAFGRTLSPTSAADGVVLNLRDVTERMMAERALEQAIIDAEKAREAAERANRAKSEFLSRMSHELRTPMNSILGFGQLLDRADLPNDQKRGVQHILKAGKHLLQLINEVLEIARIEAGRQNFSLEPVRLRGVLQEAVGLVRPLAAQRGVELDDGPWANGEAFVRADRQRMVQVLLNLLSNAVKYNRPGGRVKLSCALDGAGANAKLTIRIEDTGRGIPLDRQEELFTPFARLGAEQTEVEGTGLGLALSQRLAEAMGGALSLERSTPDGTVFRPEMGAATDPVGTFEEAAVAQPHLDEVAHSEAILLYIEDNLANLSLVESILLARPKWRTIPALQGQLGIELAREHQPDLILLDLHLPDISGEEVLKRLRADERTAKIPVIVISADATRDSQNRLESAGVDGYLTKPLDVDEFLEKLGKFLPEEEI